MFEGQLYRVKCQSPDRVTPTAVSLVSHNRVSVLGKMHADLMLPPCFQAHLHKGLARRAAQHLHMSYGPLALVAIRGRVTSMDGIFSKKRLDSVMVLVHSPFGDRHIGPACSMFLELSLQIMLDCFRLGKYEQAGSFAIQPMNDEKPFRHLFTFQMAKQQCIDRAAFLFRGGNCQEAGRLLHDNEMLILEQNLDMR